MSENPLTREYLNSLTNTELFGVAEDLGIDISRETDRFSVIDEMLESSAQGEDASESDEIDVILSESVPLPRQYNINFIEVMIRDPYWAFVFWELKSTDKEQYENAPGFEGYYLKVSPLKNREESTGLEGVFTVPLKPNDMARYLGLTPDAKDSPSRTEDRWFKVEVCAGIKGVETILAESNPIRLPGLTEFPAESEKNSCIIGGNQLITLSGYEDFRIIRRNERLHRIKNV